MLPEVIDPLLNMINFSMSLGCVPKTLKLTVKPHKKIDPRELVNNGPISILPFLSKIQEKAGPSQRCSLKRNGICEKFQVRFRLYHSAEIRDAAINRFYY